ncbi:hypothetical protein AgCh_027825 [Apium graveolens]
MNRRFDARKNITEKYKIGVDGFIKFSSVDFQGSGGGGFSPGKLRSMLMGVEKLRKQERPQEDDEMDSSFDLRSQDFEIHDNAAIVPSESVPLKTDAEPPVPK